MNNTPSCCHKDQQNSKIKFDYLFWVSLFFVTIFFILSFIKLPFISELSFLNIVTNTVHEMVITMYWGVIIGALFIGILSKIPREFIISIFGKSGNFFGILKAVFAGIFLDLCSHGILMVASKLYERGVSIGQVIAFLLASPWNSFSLTIILFALIGVKWTLLFIFLSMIIAIISGMIFDLLVSKKILPKNNNSFQLPEKFDFWKEAKISLCATNFNISFFFDVLKSAVKDSKMVVKWLLFGILLSAILRALLSPELYSQFLGPSILGLSITIFFATILEVCSEGSTPIASDIFNIAKSPGNSFSFLMSGVSTDYTEIMVLKDTTKSWKIALFLPLISLPQIILIAIMLNI